MDSSFLSPEDWQAAAPIIKAENSMVVYRCIVLFYLTFFSSPHSGEERRFRIISNLWLFHISLEYSQTKL